MAKQYLGIRYRVYMTLAFRRHGTNPDDVELVAFYESLATLRPSQLVGLWFSKGTPRVPLSFARLYRKRLAAGRRREGRDDVGTSTGTVEAILRPMTAEEGRVLDARLTSMIVAMRPFVTRRAELFKWVYGKGPAVEELVHVRLPSRERRLLVSLILASVRRKMPWMTSRLICAMAYRPEAFDSLTSALPEGRTAWGPLYHRVAIPKGARSRHLWIPNPPLKTVQKSLLCLLEPAVDRAFAPSVRGARCGHTAPIFANASAHLHRSTIVSFDIRDFFPSTTASDIIRGIKFIAKREPTAVNPDLRSRYPSHFHDEDALSRVAWSDELAVFVARAGTHRGRLPQGSPLSPLLSNVAFAPFDERIEEELGRTFGEGRFAYTRYFDDITISVSALPGSRSSESTVQTRDRCRDIVEESLKGTRYTLNDAKTRTSKSDEGHVVTGVVVRKHSLSLPRTLRRDVRALTNALKHDDFVAAARRWRVTASRPPWDFESIVRGHRLKRSRLRGYRMSLERLATLMLRRLYPDLRLTALLPDWYVWQERFSSDVSQVAGKRMWPVVEWVLATLWTGETVAVRPAGDDFTGASNRVVIRQGDTDVCSFEAESSLAFFFLTASDAVAAVDYWHHAQGMCSYLDSCPKGREFESINLIAAGLREALADVEIRAATRAANGGLGDAPKMALTAKNRFAEEATRCEGVISDYVLATGVDTGQERGRLRDTFRRSFAADANAYAHWIKAAEGLTVAISPRLPSPPDHRASSHDLHLFDYLRLKALIADKRVSADYKCVTDIEAVPRYENGNARRFGLLQSDLVEALERAFGRIKEARQAGRSVEPLLMANPWFGRIDDRLQEQVDELEKLHYQSRTSGANTKLFRKETAKEFHAKRDSLRACLGESDSVGVWEHVLEFGSRLYVLFHEGTDEKLWNKSMSHGDERRTLGKRRKVWATVVAKAGAKESRIDRVSQLIECLRHRASHADDASHRPEWVDVQKRVAALLGRTWVSEEGQSFGGYQAPGDLVLTAHEADMLKLKILLAVNGLLKNVVEQEAWRVL
jgi:hypothetical protein